MGVATTLGIVGIVVAFMISVLGSIPVAADNDVPLVDSAIDESHSVEAVHEAAGMFSSRYRSMIDEIISYQTNPSYQRAESRRQEMETASAAIVGKFKELEVTLRSKLAGLLGD